MSKCEFMQCPSVRELGGKWRLTLDPLIVKFSEENTIASDSFIISDYASVPSWKLILLLSLIPCAALNHYAGSYIALTLFIVIVWIRDLVDPRKFQFSALLHDILCTTTSRIIADGFLHKFSRIEGNSYLAASIIFFSVRLGKLFRYKTVVPQSIINEAKEQLSIIRDIPIERISFDKSKSRLLIEPVYRNHNENNSCPPLS